MRKRIGSALSIGLSNTGVTVVLASGWLQKRGEILAELEIAQQDEAAPAAVIAELGTLLQDRHCTGLPANIVLSDAWVRHWMVVPPQNAASLADCQAAAGARFHALFGEPPTEWQVAADWDARRPFLACAIPQKLLAALLQVARDHRLVLREVAPQFVVAWNRWRSSLRPGAWFGVLELNMLTFAVPDRNGPQAVRSVALPDAALRDQRRVPEMLAREALRLNLPMPPEIRLCGQVPMHWVMQETGGLKFVRLDRERHAYVHESATASLSSGFALALTGMHP